MNAAVLLLALIDLALIGSLPRIFFRRGRLTAGWWMTAAPFVCTSIVLVGALAGAVRPLVGSSLALDSAAVALLASSVALIGLTMGTHRLPLSLWHQPDDSPAHLVTCGPYSRVRHPFYSAFLLGLAGCAAAFPHWWTAGGFCYAFFRLNQTAAREEASLLASAFGARYSRYIGRTARFFPVPWSGRGHGAEGEAEADLSIDRREDGRARSVRAVSSWLRELEAADDVGELVSRSDLQLAEDVGEVGADRAR